MSNFLKLIYNEQVKLYIRKSTWVMYIILAVLIIGAGVLAKSVDDPSVALGDDWREVLEEENKVLTEEMADEEFMQEINQMFIEENDFYLDNDIKPTPYGAWQFVHENSIFLTLVSLFTIIVAAGIVANEFRWGSIKMLLIRPIPRSVILLSKYVSVLIFSFLTLLFVLVFSWVTGALLFGVEGADPHMMIYLESGHKYVSVFGEIVSGYGYQLVTLVMMATFAFMISSVFRNSALAIGLAIFLMLTGNSIILFLEEYGWAKYILFANTNLEQYVHGPGIMAGMSLTFSIIVLIVYFAVFIMLSFLFFTKRDVA